MFVPGTRPANSPKTFATGFPHLVGDALTHHWAGVTLSLKSTQSMALLFSSRAGALRSGPGSLIGEEYHGTLPPSVEA